MIRHESDPKGRWFSAFPSRWSSFLGVGRSAQDIQDAHKVAIENGTTFNKAGIFPIGQTLGLRISEVTRGGMKWQEIKTKLSTLVPLIVGWNFCANALEMLSNSGEQGMGALMGIIGLGVISLGSLITYQHEVAYGEMHRWMEDNNLDVATLGSTHNWH